MDGAQQAARTSEGTRPHIQMIEIPVSASREQALAECLRHGLLVRSDRELSGRAGSHHYHLAFADKPGTLELNEWRGKAWFSVNERRDCGWATALAREIAAAVADTSGGDHGSMQPSRE